MGTGIVILGLTAMVSAVAIVAIVFGQGFRGRVNAEGVSMETGGGKRGAK